MTGEAWAGDGKSEACLRGGDSRSFLMSAFRQVRLPHRDELDLDSWPDVLRPGSYEYEATCECGFAFLLPAPGTRALQASSSKDDCASLQYITHRTPPGLAFLSSSASVPSSLSSSDRHRHCHGTSAASFLLSEHQILTAQRHDGRGARQHAHFACPRRTGPRRQHSRASSKTFCFLLLMSHNRWFSMHRERVFHVCRCSSQVKLLPV